MKPGYELFKRLVAQPLGQAAIPSNIEEAQRAGMVSTIDTIDLDDDEVIEIRDWIRTFADTGKPIYVGIYTSFRHERRGYVSAGFPIPSANFTATLEPRNAGDHDLLLTSRSELAFPGHYLSSVDRRASGSSLVASHSWVRCPSRRSSGAPGRPSWWAPSRGRRRCCTRRARGGPQRRRGW